MYLNNIRNTMNKMILMRSFCFKRNLATRTTNQNNQSTSLQNLYDDFQSYLPKIVEKCLIQKTYDNIIEIKPRIKNIAEYDTLAREPIQGKLTLLAFHWLTTNDDLTDQKLHQIKVLAWAIELLQSYFIVGDDMVDNSETRCGKPCWHLLPDVGSAAFNDASLLRSFIYDMLRTNIEDTLLLKMFNLFNEAHIHINLGQHLDITLSRSKDFDRFTVEQYNKIAYYKSAFYTVKFPILVALALCGKDSKESYQLVDRLGTNLGTLLQMQNDLMDYIDHDSAAVKTSSDIQTGKCSWLAVAALQHCNAFQRLEFESCYGRWDPENVERILHLYKELNVLHLYKQEVSKLCQDLIKQIKDLPADSTPTPDFFNELMKYTGQYITNIAPSRS